jgi:hypothetical protein
MKWELMAGGYTRKEIRGTSYIRRDLKLNRYSAGETNELRSNLINETFYDDYVKQLMSTRVCLLHLNVDLATMIHQEMTSYMQMHRCQR